MLHFAFSWLYGHTIPTVHRSHVYTYIDHGCSRFIVSCMPVEAMMIVVVHTVFVTFDVCACARARVCACVFIFFPRFFLFYFISFFSFVHSIIYFHIYFFIYFSCVFCNHRSINFHSSVRWTFRSPGAWIFDRRNLSAGVNWQVAKRTKVLSASVKKHRQAEEGKIKIKKRKQTS